MVTNNSIQLYTNNRLPEILIINGVDRVGKDSFINEIDKQTKYRHIKRNTVSDNKKKVKTMGGTLYYLPKFELLRLLCPPK
ncbi:hypothetical protein ACW5YJ_01565 [Staphylococcus sp. mip270_02]